MFLKKLFSNKQEAPKDHSATNSNLPTGHPVCGDSTDKAKCPFMSKTPEEDPRPRGGCPFMAGGDTQKNPPLQLSNSCFDQQYVSKFRFFLSDSKMDLDFMQGRGQKRDRSRFQFNQHPIYLQHTLFYNSEDFKKVRTFECCSRFMAYEELRQKGNKEFNKGEFSKSLDYYERAYSLFRWLQYKEQEELTIAPQDSCANIVEDDVSVDSSTRSRIQLNLDSETEREIPLEKPVEADFRKEYKEYFILYCDDNTTLHTGQDMLQKYDIDMMKSLLVQILLNMSASYIMLNHYSLAYTCCTEAESLAQNMSQIKFRKAQSIVLNLSSTLGRLEEAKHLIQVAQEKRPNEKIFKEVNLNILKTLNLHDSEEAYNKCASNIEKRIVQVSKDIRHNEGMVFERAAQINSAERDIISRGMVPQERVLEKSLTLSVQFKVINRMKEKYLKVIDFYIQGDKPEQIKTAKRQLQEVLRVSHQMETIAGVHLESCPLDMDVGDRYSQKVVDRVQKVKLEKCQQPYNKGRYNFQMLEWAIKEIVEEDNKLAQQEKKREVAVFGEAAKTGSKTKYLWLLLLLPILVMASTRLLF